MRGRETERTGSWDQVKGMSRRDFLAASFLAGATAGLFAGPTGAGETPMPRPKLQLVFEKDVFADDVFG